MNSTLSLQSMQTRTIPHGGIETKIIYDIAAMIGSLAWPVVVLLVLLFYRDKIYALVKAIAPNIKKLAFAGVTLELATARLFEPVLEFPARQIDLRRSAPSKEINDSTAGNFIEQLKDPKAVDYGVIDLGEGGEWLTSRLYILSVLFARMKGIRAFVFLESRGNLQKRFVGWAEPANIQWALAKRYPWFESTYATAYSNIMSDQGFPSVIVSDTGKFSSKNDLNNLRPAITLLQKFLEENQLLPPIQPPAPANEWIFLGTAPNTFYEHAQWIKGSDIGEILGESLHDEFVLLDDLESKGEMEKIRYLLSQPYKYIAVTRKKRQFDILLDRDVLLQKAASVVLGEPS